MQGKNVIVTANCVRRGCSVELCATNQQSPIGSGQAWIAATADSGGPFAVPSDRSYRIDYRGARGCNSTLSIRFVPSRDQPTIMNSKGSLPVFSKEWASFN